MPDSCTLVLTTSHYRKKNGNDRDSRFFLLSIDHNSMKEKNDIQFDEKHQGLSKMQKQMNIHWSRGEISPSLDSTFNIALEQSLDLSLDSLSTVSVDDLTLRLFTESQSFTDAAGSNSAIKGEFK